MNPYDDDDDYRDHVNRTDWLNPTTEDMDATSAEPMHRYPAVCAWCGEPLASEETLHLRRGYWYHDGCVGAYEDAFSDAKAMRPRSALAAQIVAEGNPHATRQQLKEEKRCGSLRLP